MIKTFSEEYWQIETLQNIEMDVEALLRQRDELLATCKRLLDAQEADIREGNVKTLARAEGEEL